MNYDLSRFLNLMPGVRYRPPKGVFAMFVVDRSALAVLLPLALLVGVVWWSNHSAGALPVQAAAQSRELQRDQTVAVNLPSR